MLNRFMKREASFGVARYIITFKAKDDELIVIEHAGRYMLEDNHEDPDHVVLTRMVNKMHDAVFTDRILHLTDDEGKQELTEYLLAHKKLVDITIEAVKHCNVVA
jgi:hypothetical protein